MKELSNDDFFIKWKPIHQKGILIYEVKNTVPLIISIILINIIYRVKYPMKTEAFRTSVLGSALSVLIIIVSSVFKWFNSEKRYKYMEKIYEENIQEV